jgi:hypothetical protein
LEPLDRRDYAAAQLALRYARLIDQGDPEDGIYPALRDLGPKLLAVLRELHATPAARGYRRGEERGQPGKLQALRSARR